jgi:hypothetical protein
LTEKEICECCEYVLENLTLEDRVKDLEARIEAIELILEYFKRVLIESESLGVAITRKRCEAFP